MIVGQSAGQAVEVAEWPGALTAAKGAGPQADSAGGGQRWTVIASSAADSSREWTGRDEDRKLQLKKVKRPERKPEK